MIPNKDSIQYSPREESDPMTVAADRIFQALSPAFHGLRTYIYSEGEQGFNIKPSDRGPQQPMLERQFYIAYIDTNGDEGYCKNLGGVPKGANVVVNVPDGYILEESSIPDPEGYYERLVVKTGSNVYGELNGDNIPVARVFFRK